MSLSSSAVTYTSVYTNSEHRGYFGELMRSCWTEVLRLEHPPSPVEVPCVPEPEYLEYLVPSDDEAPMEDQPLPADASPDHVDYPADGGDDDDEPSDDDDDDDTDGEDEEPFEDEEEEEHLALADSPAAPVIDHVPSAEDTEAFETNEAAPTHVPSPRRHTDRMSDSSSLYTRIK
ncbi:hypothetical protein Tco_0207760 [Tanacetum coccineum]